MHLPRYAELWGPGYLRGRMARWGSRKPRRVWLAIGDHYEPMGNRVTDEIGLARVQMWRARWPEIAARHADSAGRSPVYTFFYPQEEYRERLLAMLTEMTSEGIADVEVHIHHDCEGEQNFLDRMGGYIETLWTRHGLLRRSDDGRIKFGFIHGNWALDNSLPGGKWCGLNNEIQLLRDLGCYADFTMPSGASPSQGHVVNEIYWAVDDPESPKSYDYGHPLVPAGPEGDLLMIPGPLGLRYRERLVPRLEVGELACYDPPTPYRVRRWLELSPRIGEDIFIKLFTHGGQDRNMVPLLESLLDSLYATVAEECRNRGLEFYFVSTWQMYQAVMALSKNIDPVTTVTTGQRAVA